MLSERQRLNMPKAQPSCSIPSEAVSEAHKVRLLVIVLGLRSGLFLLELGVGLWIHSLSLLAVAGHLLSDLFTVGLALTAAWVKQHCRAKYQQLGNWAALVNGGFLIAIAALIAWEAIKHLQIPEPVLGLPILIVAVLSFGVNSLTIHLLHKPCDHDLNLRAVVLHGITDAASSIGLILAAIAVYSFNWRWADAAVSLLVALLLSLSGVSLLKGSLQILRRNFISCQG